MQVVRTSENLGPNMNIGGLIQTPKFEYIALSSCALQITVMTHGLITFQNK